MKPLKKITQQFLNSICEPESEGSKSYSIKILDNQNSILSLILAFKEPYNDDEPTYRVILKQVTILGDIDVINLPHIIIYENDFNTIYKALANE